MIDWVVTLLLVASCFYVRSVINRYSRAVRSALDGLMELPPDRARLHLCRVERDLAGKETGDRT